MMKRIFLFFIVNLLVVVTIGVVTSLLGVNHYVTAHGLDYGALIMFCGVWGMGGAFISLLLSKWMAKFAMGVQVVDPAQCSLEEKELYQKVAQLAQKAGLEKTPEVGTYQSSDCNAFATGPTKNRSLVAVSTGLLESMSRDEVEGVLAHEIAHIANGDMVTMTLIQGVVNAFVMFFARIIAFAVSQFVREDMRSIVNFVTVLVLDIVFSILGFMVIAKFSRAREFRADKGGAALAGKGRMISALTALQRVYERPIFQHQESPSGAVAALRISNTGKKRGLASWFSTHPPLEERIKALEL